MNYQQIIKLLSESEEFHRLGLERCSKARELLQEGFHSPAARKGKKGLSNEAAALFVGNFRKNLLKKKVS